MKLEQVNDLDWDKGALTRAVIRSKLGEPCLVRYAGKSLELDTKKGKKYTLNGELALNE